MDKLQRCSNVINHIAFRIAWEKVVGIRSPICSRCTNNKMAPALKRFIKMIVKVLIVAILFIRDQLEQRFQEPLCQGVCPDKVHEVLSHARSRRQHLRLRVLSLVMDPHVYHTISPIHEHHYV